MAVIDQEQKLKDFKVFRGDWRELDELLGGAQGYAEKLAYEKYNRDRVALHENVPYCVVSDDGFVEFNFHPGQTRIMRCAKRFIVALAGRQGAKTSVAAPWLLEEMRSRGPGLYMAVAPSFPILFDSLYPKIIELFRDHLQLGDTRSQPLSFIVSREGEKVLFEGTPWEKDAGTARLPQTIIRFCHAQNAASLEAKTALACVFDEAGQEEVAVEAIEAIEGRLTTTQGRLLLLTTPYAFTWLYRRFYVLWEDCKNRGEEHPDIEVIQWPSYINPSFPKAEYERLRGTMPQWRWAMFYNGEFTRPAGQIYDCFDESPGGHVCQPFHIPDHWARYLGKDYGDSNTAAVYIAEDPSDGMLYVYRTYHAGKKDAAGHLKEMQRPSEWSQADYAFDRVSGGAPGEGAFREEDRLAGLWVEEPLLKGAGAVEAGIDIVYAFLARKGIRVFSDLEELISQFNLYSREIDPETGDAKPGTIKDKNKFHLLDALRYILVTLARGSTDGAARTGGEIEMNEDYRRAGESMAQSMLRGDSRDEVVEGEVVSGLGVHVGATRSLPPPSLLGLPSPFGF